MSELLFADSYTTELRPRLHGYVFVGSDLTFRWDHDQFDVADPSHSGHDGSYLSVRDDATGTTIGVDHDGNRRLFLYRRGGYVALGDSLIGLARAVLERGYTLTPRRDQLLGWVASGAFNEQLWSFSTVFEEIELLPQDSDVRFTPASRFSRATVTPVPRAGDGDGGPAPDYPTALADYLRTWRGRVRALLTAPDGPAVVTDLTGGLDSRTVFAFFADHLADTPETGRDLEVFSGRGDHQQRDLDIARHVLRHYDLAPAHRRGAGIGSVPTTLQDRWDHWVDNRLGQYMLASRLPADQPNPAKVSFSGVGGEQYRGFYDKWFRDVDDLLSRRRSRWFPDAESGQAFEDAVRTSLARIDRRSDGPHDPLVAHYRWFRSRFHGGCPSTEAMKVTPLAGRHADRVALQGGPDRLVHGQLFVDVMANLAPDLLDMPFDDESKRPSERNRRDVTLVDVGAAAPGRVDLGRPNPRVPTTDESGQSGVALFEERYRQALPLVAEEFRPDPSAMDDLFETTRERSRFPRQKDLHRVHQVILHAECMRLAKESRRRSPRPFAPLQRAGHWLARQTDATRSP